MRARRLLARALGMLALAAGAVGLGFGAWGLWRYHARFRLPCEPPTCYGIYAGEAGVAAFLMAFGYYLLGAALVLAAAAWWLRPRR